LKGDFSRLTFRPGRHYSAVLLQQGRVLLDSDWNEEAAIASNANRVLARDLLGPHAGVGEGFSIRERSGARSGRWDFLIEPGVYYVDGIRCENAESVSCRRMAQELGCDDDRAVDAGDYLVFLDVWERFLTAIEQPELLEPALGGVDTSTRLQVVWRVRLLRVQDSSSDAAEHVLAEAFARDATGMRARVDPASGYTGPEDHLYRVEVHASGGAGSASFKWSRDNGSVVAPVLRVEDDRLELASTPVGWPWDVGTWIEPGDERSASCEYLPPLIRIQAVEGNILRTSPGWPLGPTTSTYRSIRRWDHGAAGDRGRDGAVPIREGQWLDLEDGIQVAFDPASDLRTGDYWLMPARADGAVEWPSDASGPASLRPRTVEHHRAPLASIEIRRDGSVRVAKDLRRVIRRLTAPG